MTSTKTVTEKMERKKRMPTPPHSAPEKVQAVLAVWTERCKPGEVCRQLNINYMTFQQWQQRAMEGMLQALESRVNLTKGEVLSPRLQALLQHRQQAVTVTKLTSRLESLRTPNNKLANPTPTPAKPE
jgi:hypothetical protein